MVFFTKVDGLIDHPADNANVGGLYERGSSSPLPPRSGGEGLGVEGSAAYIEATFLR